LISVNNNYNKYWQGVLDNSAVTLCKQRFNFASFTKANILQFSSVSTGKSIQYDNKKLFICVSSDCFKNDKLSLLESWLESLLFYLKISKANCYVAVINDLDFNLLEKSKFEPKVLDFKTKEENDKNIDISNNLFKKIDLISFINRYKFDLILNFSKYIHFLDDKINYKGYAYIKSVDILQVLKDPLLNKQVLLDVLPLSN
jgi:hypothetical protein